MSTQPDVSRAPLDTGARVGLLSFLLSGASLSSIEPPPLLTRAEAKEYLLVLRLRHQLKAQDLQALHFILVSKNSNISLKTRTKNEYVFEGIRSPHTPEPGTMRRRIWLI